MIMEQEKDKRVLCDRCASNYYEAGYEVITMLGYWFEQCDICSRRGVMRIIKLRDKNAE